MSINLVLATIVVCISGVLRSTHTGPNVPAVRYALEEPEIEPFDPSKAPPPADPKKAEKAPENLKIDLPDIPEIPSADE